MKKFLYIIAAVFAQLLFAVLLFVANCAASNYYTLLQCNVWVGCINVEAFIVSLVTTILIMREVFTEIRLLDY